MKVEIVCLKCGARTKIELLEEGDNFTRCGSCGKAILYNIVMIPKVSVYEIGQLTEVAQGFQPAPEPEPETEQPGPGNEAPASEEEIAKEDRIEEIVSTLREQLDVAEEYKPTNGYSALGWIALAEDSLVLYRRVSGPIPGFDVKYRSAGPKFISDDNLKKLVNKMREGGSITEDITRTIGKSHSNQITACNQFIRAVSENKLAGIHMKAIA